MKDFCLDETRGFRSTSIPSMFGTRCRDLHCWWAIAALFSITLLPSLLAKQISPEQSTRFSNIDSALLLPLDEHRSEALSRQLPLS